jgi:hypothetical protein
MKIGVTATVALTAAFAGAAPVHAAAAGYVRCGDDGDSYDGSAGAYNIRAKRTPCTEARWLGRRWYERTADEDFPQRVGSFHCRALEPHHAGTVYIGKVLCTRDGGRRAVRFEITI